MCPAPHLEIEIRSKNVKVETPELTLLIHDAIIDVHGSFGCRRPREMWSVGRYQIRVRIPPFIRRPKRVWLCLRTTTPNHFARSSIPPLPLGATYEKLAVQARLQHGFSITVVLMQKTDVAKKQEGIQITLGTTEARAVEVVVLSFADDFPSYGR